MLAELDYHDRQILAALQRDSSVSAQALGTKIGLSQAACWRRIHRLEQEGIIQKRVAVLDPSKIGSGTIVFVFIKLTSQGRTNLDSFTKSIEKIAQVLDCYVLMGDMDYLLKVAVADIQAYEVFFFEVLSKIEGVGEIKSTMALSRIKEGSPYPL